MFKFRRLICVVIASLLFGSAAAIGCVPKQDPNSGGGLNANSNDIENSINNKYHKYGEYKDMVISLKISDKTEKLDINTLSKWINVKGSEKKYTYTINNEAVSDYAVKLGEKYSNFVEMMNFHTTGGEDIQLQNISTGWIMDTDYAGQTLTRILEGKKSVSIDLTDNSEESNKWWIRRAGKYDYEKIRGTTYAEVSIDRQYLWVYKDNKLLFGSDVITGNPNTGNDTPTGAFVVSEKLRDTFLYGIGYNRKVSYWIAFNYDIGFHDAVWQDKGFGGDVYLENGSLGCVNLPLKIAKQVYDCSYEGMPVYVY